MRKVRSERLDAIKDDLVTGGGWCWVGSVGWWARLRGNSFGPARVRFVSIKVIPRRGIGVGVVFSDDADREWIEHVGGGDFWFRTVGSLALKGNRDVCHLERRKKETVMAVRRSHFQVLFVGSWGWLTVDCRCCRMTLLM